MNFQEAVEALKQKKKLKSNSLGKDVEFIKINEEGHLKYYIRGTDYFGIQDKMIFAEDWIVEDEENPKSFGEMMIFLSQGRKAKIPEWKDQYIEFDKQDKVVVIKRYHDFYFDPRMEHCLADDWQIIE